MENEKFYKLTEEHEDVLEKNLVWLVGSPRSGSTWLGTQLLKYKDNTIWNEPYIGWFLGTYKQWQEDREDYFFSEKHINFWMPMVRKLILSRAYSQSQSLTKNIIVKEPNGSMGIDIITKCLPNSKLIFLLRDGRDVVDSLIDAHRKGSWNESLTDLRSKEERIDRIKQYSLNWKNATELVFNVYKKQSIENRYFVKYEELLNNTNLELRKIYKFLTIDISDHELSNIVNQHMFDKISSEKKGAGKFFRSAIPGKWKENFTDEEKEIMNSLLSDTLRKFDYKIN